MCVHAYVCVCTFVCVCVCARQCLHVCVCGIELLDIRLTTIKVKPWSSVNREEVFGATLPVTEVKMVPTSISFVTTALLPAKLSVKGLGLLLLLTD